MPSDVDWCDEPFDYPENTTLKAVVKQKKAVKIRYSPDFENLLISKL